METARRRAFLEAMAEKAETDGARLKALDLLERLDAREEASRRPEPPDFQYDDEWLARTAALFLGLGFAAPLIEERAREIRGRGDTRALRRPGRSRTGAQLPGASGYTQTSSCSPASPPRSRGRGPFRSRRSGAPRSVIRAVRPCGLRTPAPRRPPRTQGRRSRCPSRRG
jgi:hypothetical protein